MRKIYAILFAFAFMASATASFGQCTPDPNITNPGIYPTPADGIPNGVVGTPYSQVLTVSVPNDTTIDLSAMIGFPVPPVTVTINYQRIDAINGLPPGLSHACDMPSCQWTGGASGCTDISGTPTTAGQYAFNLTGVLNITVPASVPIIGGTVQDIPTPLAYNIEITGSTQINPGTESGLIVEQNAPNPFVGETIIRFYSPVVADFEFTVTDLAGKQIHSEMMGNVSGEQSITLAAHDYSPGIYFFSISNAEDRVTRKMVIAR